MDHLAPSHSHPSLTFTHPYLTLISPSSLSLLQRPTAVWTVKAAQDADVDKYIVVSFTNATLVLSIGENVEEVTDSGFLATSPTLQVVLLADNALLQVHAQGIRHIRPDQRTSEWKTPGKRNIERAAVNSRQVAISLQGRFRRKMIRGVGEGEIVYHQQRHVLTHLRTFFFIHHNTLSYTPSNTSFHASRALSLQGGEIIYFELDVPLLTHSSTLFNTSSYPPFLTPSNTSSYPPFLTHSNTSSYPPSRTPSNTL